MLDPTPRSAAALALIQRERGMGFIENLLEDSIQQARLDPVDRALCRELGLGCVRWQATLDWLISRRTAGRRQKTEIQVLLRMGLYQLLWLERIPPHAAVHESVELARQLGHGPQSGFLNALLRGYGRELDATRAELAGLRASDPALACSHPRWLVDRWIDALGQEQALALMDWNNTPASVFARVNTLKADPGKILQRWREEGVAYEFVTRSWLPDNLVFRLTSHPPLPKLGSFRDGWFYLQDPSTLVAPLLLDPQPGERVLDYCAAPGGKATLCAQLMRNEGRIVACDPSRKRLERVKENCTRLGATCVEAVEASAVHRARSGASALPAVYDRVLVDAPCSNTGVMRRRIDLRWRIQLAEIERLTATQLEALGQASGSVRPQGCLVYSTCSLEPEENGGVVRAFLDAHKDFELEDEVVLTPWSDQVDGAYAASLKRVG